MEVDGTIVFFNEAEAVAALTEDGEPEPPKARPKKTRGKREQNIGELKTLIWRYFISYWNNRRICSANEGLPPMVKRQRYYESLDAAA